MAKFCSNCGTQATTDHANFCLSCGMALSQTQPTAQNTWAQPNIIAPPAQQQPTQVPQQPVYQQQPPQQPVYQQQPPQQQGYQQPYAQPQGVPVMSEKQTVLANAPGALNRPDQPWEVTIEGDSIVARWKWMDATFFAPHEINNETRAFTFTVTLTDKRTWKEIDVTQNTSSGVKMSGGKMSFGSSSSTFMGKSNQKSFSFGVGKDNQTGEAGLIAFKFNTTTVKQPIRDYLTACGWKKAGMFG